MKNDQNHIDHIALISKYLAREANTQEIKLLEEWVLADEANKKIFNDYKKTWRLSNMAQSTQKISVDTEWENIQKQLFENEKPQAEIVEMQPRQERSLMPSLRLAAMFLLLVGGSLWLLKTQQSSRKIFSIADNNIKINQLPDGSTITLNNHSKLTYPKKFRGKTRNVKLEGDAFFEVARNENKPFIIQAQNVEIEVLGTSFYVNARKDGKTVEVTVKTGKVAVRAGQKEIILTPNEKGVFNKKSGQLQETNNEDKNFIAWKTKHFEFDNDNLMTVIKKINSAYHSKVTIKNDALRNCQLSATFDNQSLAAVLDIIGETLGLTIEKRGDGYVIVGGACE